MNRFFIALTLATLALSTSAAELPVGPGKPFTRIEDALAKAQSGDTILVYPQPANKPYSKTALFITRPKITILSAAPQGQRIPIDGDGFDYSGRGSMPRAIVQFNKGADGCVLEGFELYGAHNDSFNGAGVRINQANDVVVRNCHIHDNDMGIMSNGDNTPNTAVNQLIESCLIHSNGNFKEPGQNHNLYLGGTSVTLAGCEVHSSLTGHNVKSRAHLTRVIACHIHDSANREFDLVDAKGDTTAPDSHAVLFGNVIVKAPNCKGNRGVIHFGQDGGANHDGILYLAHNTIITPFIAPVATLSAPGAKARFLNNIVWDGGAKQNAQKLLDPGKAAGIVVAGQCNWLGSGFADLAPASLEKTFLAKPGHTPPFATPAKGDYRLARPDPSIVDAGEPLPQELSRLIGAKVLQYRAPLEPEDRPDRGKPDLGAYEYPGQAR